MNIVVALVFLVIGSVVFHILSPWWMTPIASNWGTIDTTIDITLYITAVVFVAVNLFLAYSVYKYRYDPKRNADYEPENKKLETWLTSITAIGVAAMLAPGLVVWADFVDVPEEAHEIEVMGEQWQWRYRLPGDDGVLGEVDARFISEDNPFGISPNDDAGLDDILIDDSELHLPLNKPVKILLRSKDVLHDFAVPQFRVKMDLVPGTVSYVWFTPTKEGKYDILCMELCGIAHYAMRGHVVIDDESTFNSWLEDQSTWADVQGIAPGDSIKGAAQYAVCGSCHGMNGEGNIAMNSPRIAGLPDWYIERQLSYYKKGIRGAHEKDIYGQQMAAMSNVLADDVAIRDVAAYIETLKPERANPVLRGDATRGKSHYTSCGACHGAKGEGNFALQAPALAGQNDWYLKRQLEHFRLGIRGTHEDDNYGHQMVLMARSLQNEQSVDDLLAYLSGL